MTKRNEAGNTSGPAASLLLLKLTEDFGGCLVLVYGNVHCGGLSLASVSSTLRGRRNRSRRGFDNGNVLKNCFLPEERSSAASRTLYDDRAVLDGIRMVAVVVVLVVVVATVIGTLNLFRLFSSST